MVVHSRLHRRPYHCKICFYYNHESDTQLWNLQDVLWSVNALLSALVHDENLGLLLSTMPGRSEEFAGHKTAEKAALPTGAIAQRCCGAVSPSLIKLYCGEDRPLLDLPSATRKENRLARCPSGSLAQVSQPPLSLQAVIAPVTTTYSVPKTRWKSSSQGMQCTSRHNFGEYPNLFCSISNMLRL